MDEQHKKKIDEMTEPFFTRALRNVERINDIMVLESVPYEHRVAKMRQVADRLHKSIYGNMLEL